MHLKLILILAVILGRNTFSSADDCLVSTASVVNNTIYFNPKDLATPEVAINHCSLDGGYLINLQNDNIKLMFMDLLNETYLTNLITIYQYKGIRGDVRDNIRHTEKLETLTDWEYTGFNFQVYSRSTEDYYTKKIVFCQHPDNDDPKKWTIEPIKCDRNWKADMTTYGGEKDFGTKPLYTARNNKFSTRASFTDTLDSVFSVRTRTYYIPDIRVFIGARSDVNQTDWFWSDGTMVNDSSYPNSSKEICQQMSLHWVGDEWELEPHECNTTMEAFYACQTKFDIEIIEVRGHHNEHSLIVTWPNDTLRSAFAGSSRVTISLIDQDKEAFTRLDDGTAEIKDVTPSESYLIKFEIKDRRCDLLNILFNINLNMVTTTNLPQSTKEATTTWPTTTLIPLDDTTTVNTTEIQTTPRSVVTSQEIGTTRGMETTRHENATLTTMALTSRYDDNATSTPISGQLPTTSSTTPHQTMVSISSKPITKPARTTSSTLASGVTNRLSGDASVKNQTLNCIQSWIRKRFDPSFVKILSSSTTINGRTVTKHTMTATFSLSDFGFNVTREAKLTWFSNEERAEDRDAYCITPIA